MHKSAGQPETAAGSHSAKYALYVKPAAIQPPPKPKVKRQTGSSVQIYFSV